MKIIAIFLGAFAAAIVKRKYNEPVSIEVKTEPAYELNKIVDNFVEVVQDAIKTVKETVNYSVDVPDTSFSNRDTGVNNDSVDNEVEKGLVFGTKYDALIIESANRVSLNPALLYRLLNQESRFRDDIISGKTVSRTGAMGIAQFMPATAIEWLGTTKNALNPTVAIPGAARYLNWLKNQFGGDEIKAVAAYNWGIGNVKRKGLDKAPKETLDYIQRVYYGV